MKTAAEPRPASLPLPGGRPGATVRLYPLLAAECKGPPAWFNRAEGPLATLKALGIGVPRRDWIDFPVVSFLIEHPGAGPVLVDTGLHPAVAVEPRQNLGGIASLIFRDIRMEPSQATPAQLRALGVEPADVGVVVMTHLHADHASAASEFPESTFLVSASEWEAATAPRAAFHGYVRRQLDHAFDYRTLDFERRGADSFASFGRAFDLFGDGSLVCVYTPGHTQGHMSVIARLKGREALLAGDAIYTMATLRDSWLPARFEDEHNFRRSLHEIQLYAKETPDALIVPGHDMEAWRALDPVYE
jgi:glyoxylase-like metal-dependent hydrolase (beta-lactamase superfamily II)